MSIAGLRFGHVAFKVADVERSVRWYGAAFGAKKIYHAQAQDDRPELMFLEFNRGQHIELFRRQELAAVPCRSDRLPALLLIGRRPGASVGAPREVTCETRSRVHRPRGAAHCVHLRPGRQQYRADGNPAGVGDLSRLTVYRDRAFIRLALS